MYFFFLQQVLFPTLDMRVKNVARTYSLEHQGKMALFNQMFELLNSGMHNDTLRRQLASCIGAIRTALSQHLSKEKKQVYFLLYSFICESVYKQQFQSCSTLLTRDGLDTSFS